MSDQHREIARMCRKGHDGVKGKRIRDSGPLSLLPRIPRKEKDASSNSEALQRLGGETLFWGLVQSFHQKSLL